MGAKARTQVRIPYLLSSDYGQGGEIHVQRRALSSGNAGCAIFGGRMDVSSLSLAQALEYPLRLVYRYKRQGAKDCLGSSREAFAALIEAFGV